MYTERTKVFNTYKPAKKIFEDIYERISLCPETQTNIVKHIIKNYGDNNSKKDIVILESTNGELVLDFVSNECNYNNGTNISIVDKHSNCQIKDINYIFYPDEIINQFHKDMSKRAKRIGTGLFTGWTLKINTPKILIFAKRVQITLSKN